jgi:hypothetical protein
MSRPMPKRANISRTKSMGDSSRFTRAKCTVRLSVELESLPRKPNLRQADCSPSQTSLRRDREQLSGPG